MVSRQFNSRKAHVKVARVPHASMGNVRKLRQTRSSSAKALRCVQRNTRSTRGDQKDRLKESLLFIPAEIWLLIFENCSTKTLLQLSTVSRQFHGLSIPLLYRTVDLSTHNRGWYYLHPKRPDFGGWQEDIGKVFMLRFDEGEIEMRHRQRNFITTLLEHPKRASHIRDFTWTLLFGLREALFWVGDWSPQQRDIDKDDPIFLCTWKIFQMLTQVQKVDFASHFPAWWRPYALAHPKVIFPTARSLRLSGVMTQDFASSFLYNPSRLTHLAIDDLQHIGTTANRNFILEGGCRVIQREWPPGSNPPGPMRGLLSPLGRLNNLKSLRLRKVCQIWNRMWIEEADVAVYREWAMFLDSISPTLEELSIEQSQDSGLRQDPVKYPMDERFEDYIWPVLMGRHWPRLKKLELVGSRDVFGFDMDDILRKHFGDQVRVVTKAKGSVRHLWIGADGGDYPHVTEVPPGGDIRALSASG